MLNDVEKKHKLFLVIPLIAFFVAFGAFVVLRNQTQTLPSYDLEVITTSNVSRLIQLNSWQPTINAQFLAVNESHQLLAASGWNYLSMWNLSTGTIAWDVDEEMPMITHTALSPTENIFASSAYLSITLRDGSTGAVLRTLESNNLIWSLAFAPDGATLASGTENGSVILWDVATGERLTSFQPPQHSVRGRFGYDPNRITSLAFSPDNATLAIGKADGTIHLWDTSTGEVTETFREHSGAVNQITFDHAGNSLASASMDNSVIVRNLNTDETAILQHPDYVFGISFSPEDNMIASVTYGVIRIWNLEDNTVLFSQQDSYAWGLTNIVFLENQPLLISSSGTGIKLWGVQQAG